jgi:sialic acid synthase
MNSYKEPYVIAEVGCNHKGEIEIAKEMITVASLFCKVDAIKFQKRNNKELLTPNQYSSSHPYPPNSYGATYGEHREYLEFSVEQHAELKEFCELNNITYSASVWDLTSAKEIASLKPIYIKIPSACNNNYEMLQWLCENYMGEIQISIGMTTYKEEEKIVDLFINKNRNKDLVIFSCTSGYPVQFEDVCLLEIERIKNKFGNMVKKIGFSGHHLSIAIDVAAYTLGAEIIERHYTLNRTWKGTDHAASLEPDGLRRLKRDVNNTFECLTYKNQEILPIEQVQRDKLKYRRNYDKN